MTPELKNLYAGKMVSDVDAFSMKPNDFKKAVNIRTSKTKGVITNIQGNKIINVILPEGVNQTIMTALSTDDNKIYYINKNSNLNHTIVELDVVSESCKVILRNITDTFGEDIFKFKTNTEISSARIINGGDVDLYGNPTNKLLVFVYEGSEPRCINLGRITTYTLPGSSFAVSGGGQTTITNPSIIKTKSIGYMRIDANRPWVKVVSISEGALTLSDSSLIGAGTYTDLEYSCFGGVHYQETLLAKAPPLYPPKADYHTFDDVPTNNLRGDLYQFVYSYEYIDFERSVWSVTSQIKIPVYDEASSGTNIMLNNVIAVTVNSGPRSVRKVRIGYRRIVQSPNDYYEAVVLDKDQLGLNDNQDYSYSFFNNETTRIIPFSEINNIDFDRIPIEAGCLEVLKNGSIILGDIIDGYDVDAVTLTGMAKIKPNAAAPVGVEVLNTAKANSKYKLAAIYGDGIGRRSPALSSENSIVSTFSQDVANNRPQLISWNIASKPPIWATWYAIVITKNLTHTSSYYGVASSLEIRDSDQTVVYVHIENLASQEAAYGPDYVSYNYSKGDRFRWLKLAESPSFLPTIFESEIIDDTFVKIFVDTVEVSKRVLKLRMTSEVPQELFTESSANGIATNPFLFEAYTPKKPSDYDNVFFHTGTVYPISNPLTDSRSHSVVTGDITSLDSFIKGRSVPFIEGETSTSNGDVQIYASMSAQWEATPASEKTVIPFDSENDPGNRWNGTVYTAPSDYASIKVSVNFSGFTKRITSEGGEVNSNLIIQKSTDNGVTWADVAYKTYRTAGFGVAVLLKNEKIVGQLSVASGNQIRAIVHHLSGTERDGLVFYPGSKISFEVPKIKVVVEDLNYDDFKKSSILTLGTPTIVDSSFRRVRRKATVLHTDPFIPNTNINGLSRIYAGYFKDFDLNHGAIKRLINKGNYVIALKESQTTNIPIGVSIISNASGATQLGLSTELLNDEQPYAGQYGLSSNYCALVDTGNNLYLADAMKGKILRLGLDGYEDIGLISEFSVWIANKLKSYKTGNRIKFGFDIMNKEVLVSFGDETLMYSEDNQGFNCFLTMLPEHLTNIGDFSYAFKNGIPYRLNTNSKYNEFFGQTYRSSLSLVFNENNGVGKVYRSIKLWANRLIAPKSLFTDLGCSTYMNDSIFEIDSSSDSSHGLSIPTVDGVFIAPIPMDENSDGGVIDGTPLRGKILEIELESNLSNSLLSIQAIQINNNQ